MPKIPMHVIPQERVGNREVWTAPGAGSQAFKGANAGTTFLCGGCRAILVKSADAEQWVVERQIGEDEFEPVARIRDIVWHCKQCGAFNEIRT